MDIIKDFLKFFNLSPAETSLLIIILAVFVWIFREVKNQVTKQTDDKNILLEKSQVSLTKILSLGYQLNSTNQYTQDEQKKYNDELLCCCL